MGDQRILKTVLTVIKAGVAIGLIGAIGYRFANRNSENAKPVLRVCAWSNYLPDEVLEEFQSRTGIKVELSLVSSNEELFAKLKAGATGFDVIQPSDYMSRQMIRLGMLREIDHAQLKNLGNLADDSRNPVWDPDLKYTIPFSWGTTGLVINTNKISLAPGEIPGWGMLFETPDPKHTSLLDDMREVFSAMLIWKGLTPNVRDSLQLAGAQDNLRKIREKILMFTSEPRQYLARSELNIAHAYSMDAIQASEIRPEFKFFIPREGAVRWADNFAIPISARHVAEAYQFLDFTLDARIASQLALKGRFSTPNQAAWQLLPDSERTNPVLYPPKETLARLHYLEDLGDALVVMNRMWAELKI
ncbi:spermidine/putrescine ABC transporter substrate-binding protein [bacterium]|nr:spermidine/putrescine ABC transporter substrate-binding protein [bacterium]